MGSHAGRRRSAIHTIRAYRGSRIWVIRLVCGHHVAHDGDMRVERCFAFVDLCGFTAFVEHFGDERTVVVLANFRTRVREIAARRGVRVTKWFGRRGHAQL